MKRESSVDQQNPDQNMSFSTPVFIFQNYILSLIYIPKCPKLLSFLFGPDYKSKLIFHFKKITYSKIMQCT